MRKLAVIEFVTLDGVMQSLGSPDEDREGGFEYGGWQSSARPGVRTSTGSATSGSARRCGSRLGGSRLHRISASCPRMRAWRWWPGSGVCTRGRCAS